VVTLTETGAAKATVETDAKAGTQKRSGENIEKILALPIVAAIGAAIGAAVGVAEAEATEIAEGIAAQSPQTSPRFSFSSSSRRGQAYTQSA